MGRILRRKSGLQPMHKAVNSMPACGGGSFESTYQMQNTTLSGLPTYLCQSATAVTHRPDSTIVYYPFGVNRDLFDQRNARFPALNCIFSPIFSKFAFH
nr:MAG TPA: hypothetical protein [Caudoviricetes sp.]